MRLIPAQYVKPFLKDSKNDYRDAEAIIEAVQPPAMDFVAVKTPEQCDLQALHRMRSRLSVSGHGFQHNAAARETRDNARASNQILILGQSAKLVPLDEKQRILNELQKNAGSANDLVGNRGYVGQKLGIAD